MGIYAIKNSPSTAVGNIPNKTAEIYDEIITATVYKSAVPSKVRVKVGNSDVIKETDSTNVSHFTAKDITGSTADDDSSDDYTADTDDPRKLLGIMENIPGSAIEDGVLEDTAQEDKLASVGFKFEHPILPELECVPMENIPGSAEDGVLEDTAQ